MTPKEKAKELVKKFFIHSDTNNDNVGYYFHAKQCALIAVGEVLDKDGYNNDFWQEVKQEIEKL